MNALIEGVQVVLPACMTFGPLFLVMRGKDARWTRILRYVGATMVCGALALQWIAIEWQKRQIELLEARVEQMDSRGR